MAPPTLLGPPELTKPKTSKQNSTSTTNDPFMDLMVSNFNKSNSISQNLPMGYTENNSATYLTSGNPCLDFFFHVVPNTPPGSLKERLSLAWSHQSLTTLKLIFNLRGVRGTGKSDKEGFYTSAIWLHQNHPKTLACNLQSLADFGYIKDLPEILYRLLEGSDVRMIQKQEWEKRKFQLKRYRGRRFMHARMRGRNEGVKQSGNQIEPSERKKLNRVLQKENVSKDRNEKRLAMAKKVLERYNRDPEFRFMYEHVSDFFAETLKSDVDNLRSGNKGSISLAAKWCPSIDSSYDKSTLLCESIARKVFPRESYSEYEGVEEAHYAYRVRDRLRKEILVPLREVLDLPEVYMAANKWDSLPYNRLASVAMRNYKGRFMKHDKERFEKYLEDVKAGKSSIAAGALLPHEIIADLKSPRRRLYSYNFAYDSEEEEEEEEEDGDNEVAELQWKRMVDDLLQKGKLRNCMAISDVSGSMSGIPMEVSVALGVLVSELSDDPWKGKLITFSENPQLQFVKGESLLEKTMFVRKMEWNMNTDFQKVFDLILKVAVEGKLKEEEMIKRLFVLSDMEFDQASSRPWETDYNVIVRKFTDAGYGNAIPEIVFWNLRDSRSTPVPGTQKGVALVSGFSKNLMKLFLDDDGALDPVSVMEKAISAEEYQKLAVVD